MNVLYANTVNEVQKLFFKKKTIAFLCITAVIPIAAAVLLSIFQSGLGIMPVNSSEYPILVLGLFTNLFLPLFITMAAVDLFSGELGDRTLKTILFRPITRFKVYISKIISIAIYIIVNLAVVFIVSGISGLFVQGKDGLLAGIIRWLTAYSVSFLPMLLIGITAALIAQFFKSSSGALAISILIFIAAKIVSTLFPGISAFLLTTYTDWHMLWIGSMAVTGKILNIFMFIVSYSIIFLTAGFYLFDRREL
ncbi:MAG: ABC transporter permease subunit [Clostridia bacterium]|nr:ABC transporter permease subunit [Clostridia bacterium]